MKTNEGFKITSFGGLQPAAWDNNNELVAELAFFYKNGKSHTHEKYEVCYITQGEGYIVYGDKKAKVTLGDTVEIPPNTPHWMEVDYGKTMVILLVYTTHTHASQVAVSFAEWILQNGYEPEGFIENTWTPLVGDNLTTSELYEKFKEENK